MHEHLPLTKGDVRRLFREVKKYIAQYRREMEIYYRFVEIVAEQHIGGNRYGECSQEKTTQGAQKAGPEEKASHEGKAQEVIEATVEFESSTKHPEPAAYTSSPYLPFEFEE